MITEVIIDQRIVLYSLRKYLFPLEIRLAWDELEHSLYRPLESDQYGIVDGQNYFACCRNPDQLKPDIGTILSHEISAGKYLSARIKNGREKIGSVPVLFKYLAEDQRSMKSSRGITVYNAKNELICLIKANETD